MKKFVVGMAVVAMTATAGAASAQTVWTGGYASGVIGAGFQRDSNDKRIRFDTNLDGTFTDTVRTAAGADAFSPGFCSGVATATVPASGCTKDQKGADFGGRLGYDWQRGALVFGALVEGSRQDATDSVSAFSTTPARYTFNRELNWVGAARARVGGAAKNLLIYGTGGAAWAGVDHSFSTSNTANTFTFPEDEMRAFGYQAGGGLEYKMGRVTAGLEYLWTSLNDDERYTVRSGPPAPATNPFILTNASGTDLQRADRFEFQAVRFSLGIRF